MALQYYPGGFFNISGQPNENEMTQYLANITAFKNGVDTARENNTQAMNMAQNLHPATTAGLALGNILGNWGGWRAGQMFQKYLEGNQKPDFQVNPMSQDAINNAVAKIMGTIPSVNGYTPPQDNLPQDYNFDLKNYFGNKTTPQSIFSDAAHNIYQKWQPQSYNDLIQKNGNGLQSTYGDNPFSKNPTGWTFSWFNRGR